VSPQAGPAFTVHPGCNPVIDWMSDVENFTPDDARDCHRRWCVPPNAVLVVVGGVDAAAVFCLEQRYSGALPRCNPQARPQQLGTRRMVVRDSWRG
jgi:predicted Zn-dependent peptidase